MAKPTQRLAALLATHGYGILMALLLLNLLTLTLSPDLLLRQLVDRFMLAAVTIVSLVATGTTRRRWIIGSTLGVLAVVQLVAFPAGPDEHGGPFPALFFFAYVMPCLIFDVFANARAISERLLAAACLYVVMALAFGQIYEIANSGGAGAFAVLGEVRTLTADEIMYFSFVTQTTLGFGDIVPSSPVARALTMIQATLGVLYLAIVIAALVSGRVAASR